MNKNKIAIILGIVCLILTVGISIQLRTIKNAGNLTISKNQTENKLRDEVLKWKEKYDNEYAALQKAEETLENERKKATENNSESAEMEQSLKQDNILLGLTEVKGKGVTVTLDDNRTASSDTIGTFDSIENYLVHDGDILHIVNELKNAGAEAICVNDQRVVQTSGITCDGNVVRINGEKVGAPYIIKAIGFPERLESSLNRPEGYLALLKRDGVLTEVKKSNSITIGKFGGVFKTDFIKNVK